MKKILSLFAAICIAIAANAQAYVGGTLGISVSHASSNGSSATVSTFSISPEAGYEFNKTWALGANLDIAYQDISGNGTTALSILPYVRATFAHAGIFDFFTELALGYSHEFSDGYDAGGFKAELRPGLIAHLSDKFSLVGRTALLSYRHIDGINGIGFGINSNIQVGVQFSF